MESGIQRSYSSLHAPGFKADLPKIRDHTIHNGMTSGLTQRALSTTPTRTQYLRPGVRTTITAYQRKTAKVAPAYARQRASFEESRRDLLCSPYTNAPAVERSGGSHLLWFRSGPPTSLVDSTLSLGPTIRMEPRMSTPSHPPRSVRGRANPWG